MKEVELGDGEGEKGWQGLRVKGGEGSEEGGQEGGGQGG